METKPSQPRKQGTEPVRTFRCSDQTWAEIQKRAKRAKKTVSAYLRDCALNGVALALVLLLGCALDSSPILSRDLAASFGAAGSRSELQATDRAASVAAAAQRHTDAGALGLELLLEADA